MPFNPEKHHRRSIRRPGYDYSASGAYFVTICVERRMCLLGNCAGGRMVRNGAGAIVRAVWDALPSSYPGIELDEFIVMPNHVHGVLFLHREVVRSDEEWGESEVRPYAPRGTRPGSLGRVLQGFKSLTTNRYGVGVREDQWPRYDGRLWQRDYFDHIIRSDWSLDRIRWYIRTNPERWDCDAENPQGAGSDDVKAWVQTLASTDGCEQGEQGEEGREGEEGKEGEHKVRPYPPGTAGRDAEGEHKVRPYQKDRGRTQGSPLRPPPVRIGHGYDLHQLQTNGTLVLGGLAVAEGLSPVAHSDGDVVLHALVDALLGAMGWGDIGEHFPNNDPQWKGAPSRVFVSTVYEKVRAAGYVLQNLDVTILAERPKLKAFKRPMAESIAGLLRIDPGRVNVKAGTNEGCDAIGRGEAIAAHAVLLLAPA